MEQENAMEHRFLPHVLEHFYYSYSMLEKHIENCPDALWNEKAGGFVFWQQLLHAITGLKFWTRADNSAFIEPFKDRNVYPEFEKDPEGFVSKAEMTALFSEVRNQVDAFLGNRDDAWLLEENAVYRKVKNIDVIQGQIRHLQYHVGHCNAALRERNLKAVGWEDNLG